MSTLSVNTVKSLNTNAPVFQNSTGTEKGQLCKAWITFDGTLVSASGTGTDTDGVLDSFNISAITDEGTGTYTITFANNMANANYAIVACNGRKVNASATNAFVITVNQYNHTKSVSAFRVESLGTNTYLNLADPQDASIAVFGD
tara:strand:- start:761 stop:1195 length:435 start_codon:yes stop_codon:yes gene_type:complete